MSLSWIQKHLNKSGYLDAIDKLLSYFRTNIIALNFSTLTLKFWEVIFKILINIANQSTFLEVSFLNIV